MNLKKAIRVTQLGDGFARFTFAPITISPNSFRSTTINGNAYNLISGAWTFSEMNKGFFSIIIPRPKTDGYLLHGIQLDSQERYPMLLLPNGSHNSIVIVSKEKELEPSFPC